MASKKLRDSVVKIDAELLKRLESFILLENNKFKYTNKKQFIDLAVLEKLKREDND